MAGQQNPRFSFKELVKEVQEKHGITTIAPKIVTVDDMPWYSRDKFDNLFLSEIAYKARFLPNTDERQIIDKEFQAAYFNRLKLIGVKEEIAQRVWEFDFNHLSSPVTFNNYRFVEWFKREFVRADQKRGFFTGASLPELDHSTLSEMLAVTLDSWIAYETLAGMEESRDPRLKQLPKDYLRKVLEIAPQSKDGGTYLKRFDEVAKNLGLTVEQATLIKFNDLRDMNKLSWNLPIPERSWTPESSTLDHFKGKKIHIEGEKPSDKVPYWAYWELDRS